MPIFDAYEEGGLRALLDGLTLARAGSRSSRLSVFVSHRTADELLAKQACAIAGKARRQPSGVGGCHTSTAANEAFTPGQFVNDV